ncbi:hypothetical protein ID871_30330 [Streptomyces pratensis]|nr:hypothetical protein [Streptomyces pratensis]
MPLGGARPQRQIELAEVTAGTEFAKCTREVHWPVVTAGRVPGHSLQGIVATEPVVNICGTARALRPVRDPDSFEDDVDVEG